MPLRAVVAMMEHETNTFSPVPTPLGRFGSPEVPTGDEVYRRFKGTGTGIGGFLDVADDAGMELVTPIAGNAAPSGPVEADAYRAMCDAICEAITQGCDVCFLDLHGAMVTEDTNDGEGALLADSTDRARSPDWSQSRSSRQSHARDREPLYGVGRIQDVPAYRYVRNR